MQGSTQAGPGSKHDLTRRLSPLFAMNIVVGLALIEPAMGGLKKLGDTLTAKQYLLIMPTGEVSYLFPAVREVPVPVLGSVGSVMLLIGLIPAIMRLRRKGLDGWTALGWTVVLTGLGLLAAEYRSKGEWVLFRRIGVRYLASAMVAVGAVLACRDRRFLAACGMGGLRLGPFLGHLLVGAQARPARNRAGPLVSPLRRGGGAGGAVLARRPGRRRDVRLLRLAVETRFRPVQVLRRLMPRRQRSPDAPPPPRVS
jgi:hypothetical protein